MKKINKLIIICFILITLLSSMGITAYGAVSPDGISYDKVAESQDMASIQEVALEGLSPIYAKDIKDGEYDITVKSSSKMFSIEEALLIVKDGKMQVVMTMGGQGYLKIYMGTGIEASQAEYEDYIDFEVDEQGRHTYTVPIEALDTPLSCAAFSKNKEKWYDRALVFEARNLPQEAVSVTLPDYEALEKAARDKRIEEMAQENTSAKPVGIDLADGKYTVDVTLAGGSGKTTVETPAVLKVKEGKAYAVIVWSSPNYDYMKIGQEKYLPVNKEGNSTFEIPVTVFDEEMTVIADTVAMSKPHEIEYKLTFDASSIPQPEKDNTDMTMIIAIIVIIAVVAAFFVYRKKKVQK